MTKKFNLIYFLEILIIVLCLFSIFIFSVQQDKEKAKLNHVKERYELLKGVNEELSETYDYSLKELDKAKAKNYSKEEKIWLGRLEEVSKLLPH